MTQGQLERTVAKLSDARARAQAARQRGDTGGYEYAMAEAKRLRRVLEGAMG